MSDVKGMTVFNTEEVDTKKQPVLGKVTLGFLVSCCLFTVLPCL